MGTHSNTLSTLRFRRSKHALRRQVTQGDCAREELCRAIPTWRSSQLEAGDSGAFADRARQAEQSTQQDGPARQEFETDGARQNGNKPEPNRRSSQLESG